jgi:V-type H+-transporting ATPase proteolipid subunit
MNHEAVMKNIMPVILAGVLGIYGLITAAILVQSIGASKDAYSGFNGYAHLASGLCCGLSALGAGLAIGTHPLRSSLCLYPLISYGHREIFVLTPFSPSPGIVGDAGVRANGQQPKLYVPMVLILIFAEALGLYGLIVAIILATTEGPACTP